MPGGLPGGMLKLRFEWYINGIHQLLQQSTERLRKSPHPRSLNRNGIFSVKITYITTKLNREQF